MISASRIAQKGEQELKRSREVSIIVDALVTNGLIEQRQSDRTRHIVKEAIKDIRKERYAERRKIG